MQRWDGSKNRTATNLSGLYKDGEDYFKEVVDFIARQLKTGKLNCGCKFPQQGTKKSGDNAPLTRIRGPDNSITYENGGSRRLNSFICCIYGANYRSID